MGLDQEARFWGTPTSRDWKDGASADADVETNGLLGRQVVREFQSSRPALEQPNSGAKCWCGDPNCALPSHKRRLNPLFVAWLMGWPLYWMAAVPTLSGAAETELYLCRQRALLRSLTGGFE
jgi:hypothetical protein